MASRSGATAESLYLVSTLLASRRSHGRLGLTGSRHAVLFQDPAPKNQPRRRMAPLHRSGRNPPLFTPPRRVIPLTTCLPPAAAPGPTCSTAFWTTQSFSKSSRASSRSKACNVLLSAGRDPAAKPVNASARSIRLRNLRLGQRRYSTAVGKPAVFHPRKP